MYNILDAFINIAENQGISITKLEQQIGASKGVLSRAISKDSDIQSKWIMSLVENYPQYSTEWILTGKGSMLKNQIIDNSLIAEPTPSNRKTIDPLKEVQRVPLFNLTATMGLVPKSNGDWDEEFVIDYLSIPNLASVDGAVYATGDSMSPYLNSGDIIAYKKIDVDMDNIFFGEVYLLSIYMDEYSTYKTIKYLHKSDRGDDYVKLVSANPVHNDKDIPLHKIAAMGLVRASIRIHN
ncbi:S24 family peptidase [Myroides marinus]|uniref:S24 family peptidase n=1 Tax=Myroides marinus TaxID=703342 RepID=UPI0025781D0B|nr:S24 family peptidase [Myroides marinus]MDM1366307.1 S24 family peptidase [Myroides marinus]